MLGRILTFIAVVVVLVIWGGIMVTIARAVDTDAKTPKYYYRVTLNDRYLNGDSGDVVVAYPADEDTTGKRQALTWQGGTWNVWVFSPDSTDVYDFYGGNGTNDTLITYMTDRWQAAPVLSEGAIASSRVFAAGVVDYAALGSDAALKSLLASGGSANKIDLTGLLDDSTLVVDTLQAEWVYVQDIEVNGNLIGADGSLAISTDTDITGTLDVSGATDIDGAVTLGTAASSHTINGSLTAGGLGETLTLNGDVNQGSGHFTMNRSLTVVDTIEAGTDTTSTHPFTGFLRLASAIKNVTYPASVVTSTVDFDGATSDMVFLAWMPTSAASTNQFNAAYLSPGKITVVASGTSPGTRAIVVLGFKR